MAKFSVLINKVIRRLSMVNGTGTQLYSEDIIGDILQEKFNFLFDETDWPQFCDWEQHALDGTLGVSTSAVSDTIKRFEDVLAVFIGGTTTQLTQLSSTTNPFRFSGTTPIHFAPTTQSGKIFSVWPRTATGTLAVYRRTKPDDFTGNVEVNFDDDVLVLGACYDYMEDDGSNPDGAEKFRNAFETRYKQLRKNKESNPISLDPITERNQSFSFVELGG